MNQGKLPLPVGPVFTKGDAVVFTTHFDGYWEGEEAVVLCTYPYASNTVQVRGERGDIYVSATCLKLKDVG